MKKIIKISIWMLVIGTAVLLAAIYLAPRLINSGILKDRIESVVSRGIEGEVKFRRIDLSFFPRPFATIHDGEVKAELAEGSVKSLNVYPKLLPLLKGKFHATKVMIDTPAITVNMPSQVSGDADKEPTPPLSALVDSLTSYVPNLDVEIKNGDLDLKMDAENTYLIKGLDLKIDIPSPGQKRLRADLKSSGLQFNLQREGKKISVEASGLTVGVTYDDDKWSLSIKKIKIERPDLKLAGKLIVDRKASMIQLLIEARDMDVQSTRDTALLLAGNIPVTRQIFRIVKGGHIPLITFTSKGDSFGALDDTENFVINGDMENGEIYIPGVDLELKEVRGEVVISKGILEGENLEARLENEKGSEGKLILGLKGKDAPFHLEMNLDINLSQLPPLLKRLVKNKTLVQEISSTKNITGNARGRLTLGESLQSVRAIVEVEELNLTADYGRIPYGLEIDGGKFSYDRTKIGVQNLRGNVGKSSFSGLDAKIELGEAPLLEIGNAKSILILDEIYPWLLSYEKLRNGLKHVKSAEGRLELSELNLKGPLLNPDGWHFKAKGDARRVNIDTNMSHGPITVKQGKFEADEAMLSLKDAEINILDTSFSVSGVMDRYMEKQTTSELTFSGEIGPEAVKWLSDFVELRVRPPLSVSQAHLVWEKDGKASFKGNWTVQKGAEVFLDLSLGPKELMIHKLRVKDRESDAAVSLNLRKNIVDFKYDGNLTGPTLENIFIREIVVSSWIRGDFQAHILMDQPVLSLVKGKLEGKDFIFPWKLNIPLTVNSISLDATHNNIKVDSAELMFGNTRLSLKGDITASEKVFLFDMDISSDGIEWDTIRETFQKDRDTEKTKLFGDVPVKGTLRLDSDYFTFDRYTWKPFHANISFDQEYVDVTVTDATLCDISFPGSIKFTSQELSLAFQPLSDDKDLKSVIACLWGSSGHMTGRYGLKSKIGGAGKGDEIVQSLSGDLTFSATAGRIYKGGLLAKVFAFLNFTEIFRGKLPDLVNEGFAYKSIEATSGIKGSTLNIEKVFIDGSSMNIVSTGTVDLISEQVDLEMLVAPLKTADFILGKIPLIKDITKGTLVSIPLRVSGDIDNPKIVYIPASAVGSGIFNILKGTLEAPVKIIEPMTGK
jgi:hypothetical protein